MMTMTLPKIKYAFVFNRLNRKNSLLEKSIEIRAYQTGSPAKFISTGIKIDPQYWDKKNKEVHPDHPNSLTYNKRLSNLRFDLRDFENKMINRYGSFSVERIREFNTKEHREYHSFNEFCKDKLENPDSKAATIKTHKSHLKKFFQDFNKGKEIYLDALDLRLIKKYNRFLIKEGLSQNSIHNNHKTLKAYINKAYREKLIK